MIDHVKLRAGPTSGVEGLTIPSLPVTVFVGPNNAGKSKVLEEIEQYCRRLPPTQTNSVVLEHVHMSPIDRSQLEADIARIEQTPRPNEVINAGHVLLGKVNPQNNAEVRTQIDRQRLLNESRNPNNNAPILGQFLSMFTLRLDGRSRLNLVGEQNAGDLQTASTNHLTHLFVNDPLREEVRRIVFEAFGKYVVIDPTKIGKLRLRLSDRAPSDPTEERGWDDRPRAFHRDAIQIEKASDGVRAFVGIIATILAGDPKIILIDEPEAFLHPALAHKLGKELASSLVETDKRLFVSTHSAQFLMGCIQSGVPINVVRLTYNFLPPTSRLLPQERMMNLMRQPLLRSTGVLNGLFFETVIVTEGDADRAFYQEINERLVAAGDARGMANALFLNAQNKQTVWDIVRPLRELGIPAIGVVDIDVLKEGGANFTKVLNGAFVPEVSREGIHRLRSAVQQAAEESGADLKRGGGVSALQGGDREGAENLLRQLRDYGVLVVDRGELESWLSDLGVNDRKSMWLVTMFERMGSDPSEPDYVRPREGDVWDFVGMMKEWALNTERLGVPRNG